MDQTKPAGRLPRDRRPRLEDVAAAVGVSTASVSLVLRNAPGPSAGTRQRVLEAAERLGYRPDRTASLLARHRTHLIGVMIDVSSTFHAMLVESLHEESERLGYDLVLSTITKHRSERQAVETLLDFRCEALVLLGPEAPAEGLAQLAEQLPVVVVGRRLTAPRVDVVRSADTEGVELAIDHLVGLGHRQIAYVDGGKGPIAADRRRGYRNGMRRHDLRDQVRIIPGDHTEESGARAAETLVRDGRWPTAIVAFNDPSALGLLDVVSRSGIEVAEQLSLIGYDDIPASHFAHVNLTTVRQDTRLQAERAVGAVVERLDGTNPQSREVVLPPQLVVRASTAAPRQSAQV